MANSLLDFVMALVRDPDAAARYAADPAGALAAAGLSGVTTADVNNLMPVVSDSLAAANPGFGTPADADLGAGNIWLSGAAAAAFDAFDIDIPAAGQATPPPVIISGDPVSDGAIVAGVHTDIEHTPIPAAPLPAVTTDWADGDWVDVNRADANWVDENSWPDPTQTGPPVIESPGLDSDGGPHPTIGDPSGF